ncbi:MAG: ABC transporter substrate-binding protein [Candidatus Binatia bacterium]
MKHLPRAVAFVAFLGVVLGFRLPSDAATTGPDPALDKNTRGAQAGRYLFLGSHDEIVANARKEGKLRVQSNLEPNVYSHLIAAFKKKYPFIDIRMDEITGADTAQRFLLELKGGSAGDLDVAHLSSEQYGEYLPYLKRFAVKAMAEKGVVSIPVKMIDADNPFVVAAGSVASAIAYNRKIIEASKMPSNWEDFLIPELKGKKFAVDIRPHGFAPLAAGLGEEWMVNYARKLKDQDPIWTRGHTRALTAVVSGEYAIHQMTNYHTCMRAAWKDRTGSLTCKVVEPVPVRIALPDAILETAPHPHAGLLWLEFQASPAAQKLIDEYEPLRSSLYSQDSEVEKITRGKKVALIDFRTFKRAGRWMEMAYEAFGFPKAAR